MGYCGKIYTMNEQHYVIDCLRTDIPSTYLEECEEVDTRLMKLDAGNNEFWVFRPPTIEQNKRLVIPQGQYWEVKKDFDSLLNELGSFDIHIPPYQAFVSDIHTIEGSKGQGLCIASRYIPGKCLPIGKCDNRWENDLTLFYKTMDTWGENMTKYTIAKYLCASESPKFLSDVFRPIQFVYSFEQKQIFLVDLDPLISDILTKDGYISDRFLISMTTLNSVRNKYFNKGYQEGVIDKKWGKKSKQIMEQFLLDSDFIDKVSPSEHSQRILRNLIRRVQYS